jgi:DNA-binding transcriptional regulator YiaG
MDKFLKVLDEEVARQIRKEMKNPVSSLSGQIRSMRNSLTDMFRRIHSLETELAKYKRTGHKAASAVEREIDTDSGTGGRPHLTPILIKKLRSRLGLSQIQFALLTGVSQPAVAAWELGRTAPRGASRQALVNLRTMTPRMALESLEKIEAGSSQRKKRGPKKKVVSVSLP